jgi:quinolinate synthase
MEKQLLINEIQELKIKHDAVILSHFYEDGDIQEIADEVGDSLYLAEVGKKTKSSVIVLAGVVFMAESAKILSPEKTVLAPDLNAGCSLVDSSPFDKYLDWRRKHPKAICVTYVNSSAKVKSITDVTCTSSNAEKIINSIPKDRQILFGPDYNLGHYLMKKLNRPMILWPGACEVHVLFSEKRLFDLTREHPDAVVIAHPECQENVLKYADVIGSTSRLLKEVENNPAKKFIIATESGIFHQMKKLRPEVNLIQAPATGNCACNECPYMKLNSLEKIRNSLKTLSPQIQIDKKIIEKAQTSLNRMMAITHGKSVTWPDSFTF